jgi:hypothetical protein
LPQPQLWSEKLSNRGPISGNWRTIIGSVSSLGRPQYMFSNTVIQFQPVIA